MALDHVRDLIHVNSITQSPTNLDTTTPALFFTRWITHLCAPVFVFLAGTSAYLSFRGSNNVSLSRKDLITRGFYLLVLEFAVVNFLLYFDPAYHTMLFEVIATIGFGFVILSLLLKLPVKTIAITGLSIISLHNLLPLIPFNEDSIMKAIFSPLFGPGAYPLGPKRVFIMAYPPVPWLGIMLAGFASGKFFEMEAGKRRNLFLSVGACALGVFSALRMINLYGDPLPWSVQNRGMYTFLSFINITKYPPSLQFCLVTLGTMFLVLALSEKPEGWLTRVTSVYGKVPLFYFLLHFLVIHLIMLAVMILQGFNWDQLDFASGNFGRPAAMDSGLTLWKVYIIWIAVVVLLYKPCKWFGRYKAANKRWWLRYI
jgi:uncharacterized membrane protein